MEIQFCGTRGPGYVPVPRPTPSLPAIGLLALTRIG